MEMFNCKSSLKNVGFKVFLCRLWDEDDYKNSALIEVNNKPMELGMWQLTTQVALFACDCFYFIITLYLNMWSPSCVLTNEALTTKS